MNNDRLSGFNPLRGLTLPGLVNYFEMGERGYYADLMWLYRLILRRNGVARAVRRKLSSAIGRLDWNIKLPDDLDEKRKKLAEAQQEKLREKYDLVENLNDAIVHLAEADMMGFAHENKVYNGGRGREAWDVRELRIVEQWHMCRDGLFAPWQYNPRKDNTNRGEPINARDWIFREVQDPAAELIALAHVKMSTTDADWDQFCDTYAVPPVFIIGPPNVRREDEPYYRAMADAVVSDGRGYLPYQSDVKTLNAGTDGVSVFVERLRFYREEIVLAGTGGILTTLSGEGAFGQGGAADNHEDTWLDIAAAICSSVSTTLQRGFDRAVLDRYFPGEERLAYFALDKPEHDRDASDVLADAKAARDAGYEIDAEEVAEKTGYKLTKAAAPAQTLPATGTEESPTQGAKPDTTTPGAAAPPAAPQPPAIEPGKEKIPPSAKGEADESLVQAALANDLEVESRWLAPAATLFAEVEAMLADPNATLDQIEAKLVAAINAVPELLPKLGIDELAQALENVTGDAAVQGLADALRAKTGKTPQIPPKP